jgi:hypothetical protein
VLSGVEFDLGALTRSPPALARIPLFLLALLIARGAPAALYAHTAGRRGAVAAGFLQATSLPVIVTAASIRFSRSLRLSSRAAADLRQLRSSRPRTAPAGPARRGACLESVLLSPSISSWETGRQRSGAVPGSGSEMGAGAFGQVRSDTVREADRGSVTCADARELTSWTSARPVRDEEVAGSDPATPTK